MGFVCYAFLTVLGTAFNAVFVFPAAGPAGRRRASLRTGSLEMNLGGKGSETEGIIFCAVLVYGFDVAAGKSVSGELVDDGPG